MRSPISTLITTLIACIGLAGVAQAESDWLRIGHANNTVDVTVAADHLFAVTKDNKLWIRQIRHEDIPWRHIGHAESVVALATADNRLYAASRDNKLWSRPATDRDIPWSHVGHANNMRAMAGVGTRLYAATGDNRLWSKDVRSTAADWQYVGHANNVIAMASVDNTLYAVTRDNLLWHRPASLSDMNWTRVGRANSVAGMTAHGGNLYATTTDNLLWTMTVARAEPTAIQQGIAEKIRPRQQDTELPAVQRPNIEFTQPGSGESDLPAVQQLDTNPKVAARNRSRESTLDSERFRDAGLIGQRFTGRMMASAINSYGSRDYRYMVMGRDSGGGRTMQALTSRPESRKGLMLMRDTGDMKSLGSGLFDDGQGNLVASGSFLDDRKERVAYAVTMTPWGENVFSVDRNADGLIDVAIGSRSRDRLWLLGQDDLEWLRACFEQSDIVALAGDQMQAAALCTQCLSPDRPDGPLTAGEQGCLKDRAGGSGGGGLGGGGIFGGAMPGASGFLEPNCGARRPGEGMTTNPSELRGDANEHRLRATLHDDLARWARIGRDRDSEQVNALLADLHGKAASALEAAAAYTEKLEDLMDEGRVVEAEEMGNQAIREIRRVGKLEQEIGDVRRSLNLRTVMPAAGTTGGSGSSEAGSGDTTQPGIGPDGSPEVAFEDPRCGGSSSAFWEMCGQADTNVMECARNLGDSAYALTGGRCRTETGPDDEEIVICYGQQVDRGPRDPGDGRPSTGGVDSGPTELRMPETGGGGPGRMIDYTPLGGFILALCARGGCPDAPVHD